jgi:hypothetical protein
MISVDKSKMQMFDYDDLTSSVSNTPLPIEPKNMFKPVSINNPNLKEIINNLNRAHIGVVVDNVEMVLQSLLGCQIDTITFDSPNVTNVVDRYEEEIEDLKKELAACYREKEEDQGTIKKLRSICISQQEVIMDYEWDKMHRAAIAKKCNRRRFAR